MNTAKVINFPTPNQRRRRQSSRELGVNPRALGLSPRQLVNLSADERAERLRLAAAAVVERVPATRPTRAVAPARPMARLGRPAGMAGCPACGGTGWAEAGGDAVTECECRHGVIL